MPKTPPTASPKAPGGTASTENTLRMAAVRLAHILTETLDGKRRFGQLTMWFDSASLGVLADRHSRWKGGDIHLASVRVQATSDHSAEVALRLTTSGVSHAVALTVNHSDGQWSGRDVAIG